ncbi:hypothetical protein SODALDRAFT_357596 [Sodiomyces alkalinus F11]|uniref:Uncharacterized protein n=1 Tax=Sodiomyces alkalinus (strain CBS 110278 / VKM F-3762 / F11) TaxID=1314773 RepID=A0A3N2Q437_SODAK|nr:hypothetical protein SODALDRAFT_357596 [Sodiomyces alkalinus F11]ROT41541.1 hypothetical protein SODALDRAFT_357596 [Sodiomyces alkalinus F11]
MASAADTQRDVWGDAGEYDIGSLFAFCSPLALVTSALQLFLHEQMLYGYLLSLLCRARSMIQSLGSCFQGPPPHDARD